MEGSRAAEQGGVGEQPGDHERSHVALLGKGVGGAGGAVGRWGLGGAAAVAFSSKVIAECASVSELLWLRAHVRAFTPEHTSVVLAKLQQLLYEGDVPLGEQGLKFVSAVLERTGELARGGDVTVRDLRATLEPAVKMGVLPSAAARLAIVACVTLHAPSCSSEQAAFFVELLKGWNVVPTKVLLRQSVLRLVSNAASLGDLLRLDVSAFSPELTSLALAKLCKFLKAGGGSLSVEGEQFVSAVLEHTAALVREGDLSCHSMRGILHHAMYLGVEPSAAAREAIVGRVLQLACTCSPDNAAFFTQVLTRWEVLRLPELERVLLQRNLKGPESAQAKVQGTGGAGVPAVPAGGKSGGEKQPEGVEWAGAAGESGGAVVPAAPSKPQLEFARKLHGLVDQAEIGRFGHEEVAGALGSLALEVGKSEVCRRAGGSIGEEGRGLVEQLLRRLRDVAHDCTPRTICSILRSCASVALGDCVRRTGLDALLARTVDVLGDLGPGELASTITSLKNMKLEVDGSLERALQRQAFLKIGEFKTCHIVEIMAAFGRMQEKVMPELGEELQRRALGAVREMGAGAVSKVLGSLPGICGVSSGDDMWRVPTELVCALQERARATAHGFNALHAIQLTEGLAALGVKPISGFLDMLQERAALTSKDLSVGDIEKLVEALATLGAVPGAALAKAFQTRWTPLLKARPADLVKLLQHFGTTGFLPHMGVLPPATLDREPCN